MIARASAMIPTLCDRVAVGERDRRLPPETIAELRGAGFYRVLQPKRYGGYEMAPSVMNELQIELSRGDMSVGWVYGVTAVLAFHLALLHERAQDDVWSANPDALLAASYMPTGKATPVEGGFRLSGRWGYASGVDHCDWIFLGGLASRTDDAPPDACAFLLPRRDVEIIDNWRTMGLRATGSHDVAARDIFVPAYRVHRHIDRFSGASAGLAVNSGPLYRLPLPQLLFRAITSSCIGALQAMLDAFIEHNRARITVMGASAAADAVAQCVAAETLAAIDEMRAMIHRNVAALTSYAARREEAPIRERQIQRMHATMVPERCCALAQRLFKASGTSALLEEKPFARILADLSAARQHAAVQYEQHGRVMGAAMMGIETTDTLL